MADIENTLEILKQRAAQKMEAARTAILQQNADSEAQARIAEAQYRREELARQSKQLDLTHQIAQATSERERLNAEREMSKDYVEFGITPPEGKEIQVPGLAGNLYRAFTVPGSEKPVILPSKDQALAWQRDRAQALYDPRADVALQGMQNKLDIAQAQQASAQAYHQQQLDQRDRALAELNRRFEEGQSNKRDNLILGALLKNQGGAGDFDLPGYLQGIHSGSTTKEDISKLPKGQKAAVTNALSKLSDVTVPLSQKQQEFLKSLGPASGILNDINDYRTLVHNNISGPWNPSIHNQAQALQDNIKRQLTSLSTGAFGQSARALSKSLQADLDAYTPMGHEFNKYYQEGANQIKFSKLVGGLHDAVKENLYNIPQDQLNQMDSIKGLVPYFQGEQQQQIDNPNNHHLFYDPQTGQPINR
jgi:hypothetical protein